MQFVWYWRLLQDALFAFVLLLALSVAAREGAAGLARRLVVVLKLLPGAETLVAAVLRRQVRDFLRQIEANSGREEKSDGGGRTMAIPKKGLPREVLLEQLSRLKAADTNPHEGKIFAYVYTAEDERFQTVEKVYDMFEFETNERDREEEEEGKGWKEGGEEGGEEREHLERKKREEKVAIVQLFSHAFLHENALNPMVFPSLRRFETEIVAMAANLLHGNHEVVGNVTSGGTESILMAVKTYRDRARKLFPQITAPEMVAPLTIHPAFEKAASYFTVKMVHVPLNDDLTPNMAAYKKAISPSTILLLCSAPEYCYGMVDPVPAIAELATERRLPLHVDACFGGFMLPWVKKLGYEVPEFDFWLPGVTSMSADIHKYGLGIKGSSVVLYRSPALRHFQIFSYSEWPGGLFGSPGMAGTRPGGNIASSWAVLQVMGQDGYMQVAGRLMKVTQLMKNGIATIPGIAVCGSPSMTAFSVKCTDPKLSIFAIADQMEAQGWKMERQRDTLHCTVLPSHTADSANKFVTELKVAVETVKTHPSLALSGTAGVYGMVGRIPDHSIVQEFVVEFFNELYKL